CPEMFAKGILLPQDSFGAPHTLSQRLQSEIDTLENLGDIPLIETSLLFECQFLSRDRLKSKIERFISTHAKEILTGFYTINAQSIWNQLVRFQFLPEQVKLPLRTGTDRINIESLRNGQRLREIQSSYEEAIQEARRNRDTARSEASRLANLNAIQAEIQRLE